MVSGKVLEDEQEKEWRKKKAEREIALGRERTRSVLETSNTSTVACCYKTLLKCK